MQQKNNLKLVALATIVILAIALPCWADDAQSAPESAKTAPLPATLERVSDLLGRLGDELDAVDRPAAERLRDRVDEAGRLVASLIAGLEEPDGTSRAQVVRLDLALHRLVTLLEEVVGEPQERPESARAAKDTLEQLRAWVDGYVAGATAGMNARDAERFSQSAHDLARALAAQMARLAQRAEPSPQSAPTLPQLVARLEALAERLDQILLQRANAPKPES